ncbi:MAG TPA: hypothetical protein V6D03_00480, partial [Candidatus Caenarcaniphilales bacterium]
MPFFRSWLFAFSTTSLMALSACNSVPTSTNSPTPATTPSSETTTAAPGSTDQAKDVDYMTNLGLMKGHLLVAKELLNQGKPDQAEPHIGHPVEEIYADIEPQLQAHKVEEFKTTLNGLHDLVQSKPQ